MRTLVRRLEGDGYLAEIECTFAAMIAQAELTLDDEAVPRSEMVFERSLDVRYVGQEYTVSGAIGRALVDETSMIGVRHQFHRLHERQYGHSSPEEPLEIVDLRLAAHGLIPRQERKELHAGQPCLPPEAILGEAETLFGGVGTLRTPLINRELLAAGNAFEGPAIVVERTATSIIEPDFQAQVLATGEILLSLEG